MSENILDKQTVFTPYPGGIDLYHVTKWVYSTEMPYLR